jgi:hypothetical protein
MNFREAQTRLLAVLQDRIRNGDLTERGIARLTGISQPHIHNVLKRVRTLSPGVFDVILETFNLTLLDLCSEEELRAQLNWRSGLHPMVEMAVLESAIGPKMPWPAGFSGRQRYPVPAAVKNPPDDLVLARLTPDEWMSSLLSNYDLAILDISERARTKLSPSDVYAVERQGEVILRYVRYGGRCLYLSDGQNLNFPARWEALQLPEQGVAGLVRARVIWVGRESNRRLPPHQRGRFLTDATSR